MRDVHTVACHLEGEARRRPEGERDSFARSTFNRFYYATFLEVRSMLKSMGHANWQSIGHKSYPDVLSGIAKELKKDRQRLSKLGDSSDAKDISLAITALASIADVMKSAYAVRVAADYSIEIPIDFREGGPFYLNNVGVNTAKGWREFVSSQAPVILRAWKQVRV